MWVSTYQVGHARGLADASRILKSSLLIGCVAGGRDAAGDAVDEAGGFADT